MGCLAALLAITVLAMFLTASCTEAPEADGRVLVIDEVGLLTDATRTLLSAIRFPEGTAVIVRTVDSIPAVKMGRYATDRMPEERQWQLLRPRGFLRTYFRQDPAWARGVYVLLSRNPELMQIRFGQDLRLAAYQEGLAAGDWYREQQEFAGGEVEYELEKTLLDLAKRMEPIAESRWPLSWARATVSWVQSDIEDFLAPSDGLYSRHVLANYIRVAALFGGTGSVVRFVAFNLIGFALLWGAGKKILLEKLLLPRTRNGFLRFLLVGLSNLALLGVLVTAFATMALLSHGRIEDELALEALGLPFFSKLGFDSAMFSTTGGLWLAIPGALIALVRDIGEIALDAEAAKQHGESRLGIPVLWLGWACALYLFPLPIALPAFVVLIGSTGMTLKGALARP
jgi:hypothetical protein